MQIQICLEINGVQYCELESSGGLGAQNILDLIIQYIVHVHT